MKTNDESPALQDRLPPRLQEALREAKSRLQSIYGNRLRRVVLYGSYARSEAASDSDVDLLVVLEGPIDNRYQEVKRAGAFKGDFLTRYRLSFSVHPYTEEEYQDLRRPFIRNVHGEGIEL